MKYWLYCQAKNPGWQLGMLALAAARQAHYDSIDLTFLALVVAAALQSIRVCHHYLVKGGAGIARPGLVASIKAEFNRRSSTG